MSDTTTLIAALENVHGIIIPLIREDAASIPEASARPDEMVRSCTTLVISPPVIDLPRTPRLDISCSRALYKVNAAFSRGGIGSAT